MKFNMSRIRLRLPITLLLSTLYRFELMFPSSKTKGKATKKTRKIPEIDLLLENYTTENFN